MSPSEKKKSRMAGRPQRIADPRARLPWNAPPWQRAEIRYRSLIELLPQKVFLKSRDGLYLSCNSNLAADPALSAGIYAPGGRRTRAVGGR